ncbi:MAG: hypothetical protein AAGD09_27905 [Cyanobacteria bacterium P01_F01_bin.56]
MTTLHQRPSNDQHRRLRPWGKNRGPMPAADHDFKPPDRLPPFGILRPAANDRQLSFVRSQLTVEVIVDCWENEWPQLKARCPHHLRRWLINADNGPFSHRITANITPWCAPLVDSNSTGGTTYWTQSKRGSAVLHRGLSRCIIPP